MESWQKLEKNATQIMIFFPIICGRKIIKVTNNCQKLYFCVFQQFLNHELWIQRKSIPEQQIMENSDKIGHFDLYGPRKYLKNTYARKIFL